MNRLLEMSDEEYNALQSRANSLLKKRLEQTIKKSENLKNRGMLTTEGQKLLDQSKRITFERPSYHHKILEKGVHYSIESTAAEELRLELTKGDGALERDILRNLQRTQFEKEELEELARKAIEQVGAESPREMGQVMKVLVPQLKGRATGQEASQAVRRLLQ